MMSRNKQSVLTILKYLILTIVGLILVFPLLWMALGMFKTNNQIWQEPYKLLPYHWDFGAVFESIKAVDFNRYVINSLFVGIVGTGFTVVTATFFTYAMIFIKSRHTEKLLLAVLIIYMLPSAVTYVPSYVILARIGLLDTLSGLMFSNLASVFIVFYLRQSFKKMSHEYIEAARMDGAGHFAILRHVVFPLNKSAFYTVGVLTFVQNYSSYMWPSLILNSQEKYLVSQGLRHFFIQGGAYGMNWSEVMLTSTMTVLPILIIFIVGQRWFTTGILEDSGIK